MKTNLENYQNSWYKINGFPSGNNRISAKGLREAARPFIRRGFGHAMANIVKRKMCGVGKGLPTAIKFEGWK